MYAPPEQQPTSPRLADDSDQLNHCAGHFASRLFLAPPLIRFSNDPAEGDTASGPAPAPESLAALCKFVLSLDTEFSAGRSPLTDLTNRFLLVHGAARPTEKPAAKSVQPPKMKRKEVKERPGDWICAMCGNMNFAFRDRCNRCSASKVQAASLMYSEFPLVQEKEGQENKTTVGQWCSVVSNCGVYVSGAPEDLVNAGVGWEQNCAYHIMYPN